MRCKTAFPDALPRERFIMAFPPLRAIQTFEVVMRLGSISKAAEELSLTPSAVSHQITNLEALVGRKLFERTARGVELTPAGERYQQSLAGALAVIASAAENARAEGIEVLRIQASPSFAALWLVPDCPGSSRNTRTSRSSFPLLTCTRISRMPRSTSTSVTV